MRILVINPNTTEAMTHEIDKVARAAASKGTDMETVQPKAGPRSIEGNADEVLAAYHTLEVVAGSKGKYDAYVIACYGDPALAECREVSSVPVIGIAEPSIHMAGLVAYKWSIVYVLPRVRPLLERLVHRNGMVSQSASIRCAPLPVTDVEEDINHNKRMMVA